VNIEWAFLAVAAAWMNGRWVVTDPGADRFVVPDLPAHLALPVFVNLRGMPEDFPGEHDLEIHLFGPGMTALTDELAGRITLPEAPADHDPRQALSKTMLFVPPFVTTTEGSHGFDLRVNNRDPRLVPFMVVKGTPPPQA
jgi:hypothetical protein